MNYKSHQLETAEQTDEGQKLPTDKFLGMFLNKKC